MKIFGMRIAGGLAACLLGFVALGQSGRLMAQASTAAPAAGAATGTASVHGHVQDPIGIPLAGGVVKLTTDRGKNTVNRKFEYTFPIDNNGDYKGTDIKPGTYLAVAFNKDNVDADYQTTPLAAGEDKAVDFDMTRKAYIDNMTPAERERMEETKKANAEAMAKNAKIENLNGMLKQARADMGAGNYASAVKSMTDATAAKPDEAILWETLGDAQLGDAGVADKAAKAAKATDASIPGKLLAAVTSYQKALSLNAAASKPNTELTSVANNQLGQALGRLSALEDVPEKRTQELKGMADAFDAAAKADPKGASKYYLNESVTLYNASLKSGKVDGLSEAADKAIAADPTKSDGYFFKSQALAPLISATPDGKGLIAPPGLVDACNKYLELAPNGIHAADLKGILAGLQVQITTTAPTKPGKKK
jgi:hypothetical protein